MLRWDTTLAALATRLNDELAGVTVIENADAATPREATVILRRGPSAAGRSVDKRSGAFTLLLECWAFHETDKAAANAALAELEESVIEQINAYVGKQCGQGLHLAVDTSIDPDGDYFRPSVASQITAAFAWRVRRPLSTLT